MLVLSRKSHEAVVVGGSDDFERLLKVIVLAIEGNKVRLGFEIAADVPVHRLEVWERIRANAQPQGPAESAGGASGVHAEPPSIPVME